MQSSIVFNHKVCGGTQDIFGQLSVQAAARHFRRNAIPRTDALHAGFIRRGNQNEMAAPLLERGTHDHRAVHKEELFPRLAARVGSAPEQVAMALESIVEPASLYEPAYTDGDDTLAIMDRVQEVSCEESWISDIMFKDTVQALTPRERRIIALRYLSGQTQMQVAQAIGISQAQVSRLEKCALNHIKEQISCR